MRAPILALGWLGTYYVLAQYGAYALPPQIAKTLTLPQYLAAVQIVSILLGVSLVLVATRQHRALRQTFFPELAPEPNIQKDSLAYAFLLAPLVYLCALSLGMYFAFDTLIAELAARGAKAVQQQTGELGRTAQVDTLWTILPFTVLIAPLGEELLFRGGIYGAVQSFFSGKIARRADDPPPSIQIAGIPRKSNGTMQRVLAWSREGGLAVIASSLIFGVMHADTPSGMGIVRVVSASVLGLACGLARHISGGVFAPLVLHATYNLLSLATLRGWLLFESWPTRYAIPTVLVPLSCATTTLALFALVLRRKWARPKR